MPSGIYNHKNNSGMFEKGGRKGCPPTGKHWKIKDTSRMGKIRKGKHCSPNSEFKKGHPNYSKRKLIHKTDESKIWRGRIEYRLWREAVFARDGWICQKCKEKGIYLHPHHILNFSIWVGFRFAIDNGITFCQNCHKLFHKKYGVKNNTKEQLEEFLNNCGKNLKF